MMTAMSEFFYILLQGAMTTILFYLFVRSKVKDVWLQQGNVILRQATTNQILTLRCRSKQQLQNDNIVDAMIEFLRPALYPKKLQQ